MRFVLKSKMDPLVSKSQEDIIKPISTIQGVNKMKKYFILLLVIILTSSKMESDLITSYDLGVNAYVVKPVEFEDFVKAVKELGSFWAILNEPPPKK